MSAHFSGSSVHGDDVPVAFELETGKRFSTGIFVWLKMGRDTGIALTSLRADGGPIASDYPMQFKSDMYQASV